MKKFFASVPIPLAGVALGLTALGNLLQSTSEGVRLFCGALGLFFILLLVGRIVLCPKTIREDLENPIIASVSATFFMSLMQLAGYAYPYIGNAALLVWGFAVLAHLGLIIYYTKKFLLRFRLEEVFPTCFITYVGIIVGSVTSSVFHLEGVGKGLFWLGFIGYALMFVLVTKRYLKHEVAEPSKPLFCIYAAPMSLSLAGYLTVMDVKSLPFMIVLEILAQLLFFAVLLSLPKLLRLRFYPSYAAFTFPFVITAFALKKLIAYLGAGAPGFLEILLLAETVISVGMVAYTVIRYAVYLLCSLKGGVQKPAKTAPVKAALEE